MATMAIRLPTVDRKVFSEVTRTKIYTQGEGISGANYRIISTLSLRHYIDRSYFQKTAMRTVLLATSQGLHGDVSMFVPFSAHEAFVKQHHLDVTREQVADLIDIERRSGKVLSRIYPNFFYLRNKDGSIQLGEISPQGEFMASRKIAEAFNGEDLSSCYFLACNPPRKPSRFDALRRNRKV